MKIIHRTPGARGLLHGVAFKNGIGHSDDPTVLAKLRAAGHEVEDEIPERTAEPGEALPPLPDSAYRPDAAPLEVDPWTAPQA